MAFVGHPTVGPHNAIGRPSGATNLVTNGGFETNVTGWVAGASNGPVTRVTTRSKFGAASGNCAWNTGGAKFLHAFSITLTAAAHTVSAWVYIPANWDGGPIRMGQTGFTSAVIASQPDANMALTDQWQRIQMVFTPNGADLTGFIAIEINGADPSNGRMIGLDGVQVETGSIATPYIETDGASASRDPLKWVA